jgi:hypothetical protein
MKTLLVIGTGLLLLALSRKIKHRRLVAKARKNHKRLPR